MQVIQSISFDEQAMNVSGVYFLQTETPYQAVTGKKQKTVSLYVGYDENIAARLKEHRANRGARLTEVWNEAGISYDVVFIIPGATRFDERKIKKSGHYSRQLKKLQRLSSSQLTISYP